MTAGAYFKQLNPALPTLAAGHAGPGRLRQQHGRRDARRCSRSSTTSRRAAATWSRRSRASTASCARRRPSPPAPSRSSRRTRRHLVAPGARTRSSRSTSTPATRPSSSACCKGLAVYEPIVEKTFGGLQPGLHITVEAIQRPGPLRARRGAEVPGHPRALLRRAAHAEGPGRTRASSTTATATPAASPPASADPQPDGGRRRRRAGARGARRRGAGRRRHALRTACRRQYGGAVMKTFGALYKLIIFMVVTTFLTFMLAATIGNFGVGKTSRYHARVHRRDRPAARQRGPDRGREGRQGQEDRASRASSPTSPSTSRATGS